MATILIVDDHESNRELLTTLLGYQHHHTVEAREGAEALERARATRPDLIITDIVMPIMDGYELTRRLREEPDLAAIPVIFYSAQCLMQDARALAAKCGVEYVIAKPAEPETLLHTVDAALSLTAPASATAPIKDFDREHVRVLTDKVSLQAEEVQNLNARLTALIDITRELNVAEDPWSLVERYTKEARKVIGAVCASACITDESGCAVRHFCSHGVELAGPEGACPGCGLGGPVVEELGDGAALSGRLCPAHPEAPACPAGVPALNSHLVVPILTRSRSYGWLGLGSKIGGSAFTPDDEILLMTLAAQLAMGYENSRLFDELKQRAEDLENRVAERRRAAEKYRMVVDQASDGIAIADEQGRYLEVNPKMLDMLGYTREQFLDLSMQDLIPNEDLNDPIQFDRLRPGNGFRKERRLIRKDGSFVEAEIGMNRLEDGRAQAIVRDVTERNRLETQLRQSQKLEAVGRLAGGVAHDFNNLLTVILGHSDLALSSMDAHDRRRGNIEDIREAGKRAAVLTSQMLAFSRRQVLRPKVLSVSAAVANLTKMMGRLITSNIEIKTRKDVETWRVKVDPGQLDQVLLNLALNARDAMPLGGQVTINTANRQFGTGQMDQHPEAPAGDYLMLSVTDTGTGMDAETRSHLFEPFFTTKMPGRGTGLGLSTVYGIVHQSHGFISVHSELGCGTTMSVYLPRVLEAEEAVGPNDENDPLPVGHETILLAEDEDRVRSLAAIVLSQQGYKVIEACDGQEAWKIAERCSGEIHLLFSDIMMPRLTGPELAEQLRRSRPGIKVLLTSGYASDAVMQQGILDPSIPILQKPFTARTLAFKVREVLDAAAAGGLPEEMTRGAQPPEADEPALRSPM